MTKTPWNDKALCVLGTGIEWRRRKVWKRREGRGRDFVHSKKGCELDSGGNKEPVTLGDQVMRLNFFV